MKEQSHPERDRKLKFNSYARKVVHVATAELRQPYNGVRGPMLLVRTYPFR
jgi:hypothetical protein